MGEGKHCRFLPFPERLHEWTVPKDEDDSIFGDNAPDNGDAYGNAMCHASFVGSIGVIDDESEGESDEEEDEGLVILLDDPNSDSDDEDNNE